MIRVGGCMLDMVCGTARQRERYDCLGITSQMGTGEEGLWPYLKGSTLLDVLSDGALGGLIDAEVPRGTSTEIDGNKCQTRVSCSDPIVSLVEAIWKQMLFRDARHSRPTPKV